jgi:VWFA-related protein
MSSRSCALCFSLPLLIASAGAFAQQNPEVPTFRSKTEVVLVPVLVRSKTGPAEGLKAEQFSVSEDGKPQKIVSVELIKTGTNVKRVQTPGEFSNELVAPGPARLTVIGIDMINTPFLDQSFARQQLIKYLSSSTATDEQTAIFGMYKDGSVRLFQDISTDSVKLAGSVKSSTGALPNSAADTKTTPTSNTLAVKAELINQSVGPHKMDVGTGDPVLSIAANEQQALESFQEARVGAGSYALRRNMEATLSSMRQIAEAYWGAPGRKSFIWITGNFPFDITGSGEFISPKANFTGSTIDAGRYQATHSGALPPLPETASLVGNDDLAPLRQQYRELLQEFASGNIVLYPLDARGLMTLNLQASDTANNPLLLELDKENVNTSQTAMETMSKMTGGKTCYNKNEIESCIRDASRDSDEYYLVTYNRDKKNKKPGWRKLSVKVDQPDVEVRARTGYFFGSDPADKNARDREVAMAMHCNVSLSAVPFSASFKGVKGAGDKKIVKYEIYIPPATVEAADLGDNKFQLEVITVATTPKSTRVDEVAEVLGLNLPPEAIAAIHQQGIAYDNVLKVPPGEYTVHFMVRNVATNVIGSVIAPLKVE